MSNPLTPSKIDRIESTVTSAESSVKAMSDCISNTQLLASTISSTILSWKQIDSEMHKFDLEFKSLCKQMDVNLEMYKIRTPIVREQLNSVSRLMEKVLDKVLEMDAITDSEMTMKMRYIDMVDDYMNNLTKMITKLL